jgi:hypothetical protein
MSAALQACCYLKQSVQSRLGIGEGREVPEIEANDWPTVLFGNARPVVVSRRRSQVATWGIRPDVECWQRLGEEVAAAWAQRLYEVDTVIAVWNDVGELVHCPRRKARAGVQRVPELRRKVAVFLAKQVESGWLLSSRNAGVEENTAARRSARPRQRRGMGGSSGPAPPWATKTLGGAGSATEIWVAASVTYRSANGASSSSWTLITITSYLCSRRRVGSRPQATGPVSGLWRSTYELGVTGLGCLLILIWQCSAEKSLDAFVAMGRHAGPTRQDRIWPPGLACW